MPLSLVYESEYEFQFHAEQYIYQMYNCGKTYGKKKQTKKSNTSRAEVNAFIQLTRKF